MRRMSICCLSLATLSLCSCAVIQAFAQFRQAISSLSDADLAKSLKLFGQQTTYRGAFFVITGHTGEHLGQSIAYARMNGIVPPWTEEFQRPQ